MSSITKSLATGSHDLSPTQWSSGRKPTIVFMEQIVAKDRRLTLPLNRSTAPQNP